MIDRIYGTRFSVFCLGKVWTEQENAKYFGVGSRGRLGGNCALGSKHAALLLSEILKK